MKVRIKSVPQQLNRNARNSRRWKHGLGGNLFSGTSQPTQKMQIGLDVQGWPNYSLGDIMHYAEENQRRATIEKEKPSFIESMWNTIKDTNLAYIDNPSVMTAAGHSAKTSETHYPTKEEQRLASNLYDFGEGALGAITAAGDVEALYNVIRHPVQTIKATVNGTKRIAAEIANKVSPQSVISDNDAHVLAADAKYAIKKYVNSKQERDRIKAALKRNNENGSHADWEVAEMNSNLNDSRLTLEPQVYSDGKPVHGVTIKDGRNIDVKLTTNRESPDDLLFTGEHEYGHVTETDKILELLKKEWGDLEVNPEYYMVNGVEDPVLKAYYTGIPENRSMSLAVQADMYDRGFSSLGKYLEYLKNNRILNEQWLKLKNLHGEEKAKKLVESVFGLSPLIYIGGKNQ